MTRKVKNIVMCTVLAGLIGATAYTNYYVVNENTDFDELTTMENPMGDENFDPSTMGENMTPPTQDENSDTDETPSADGSTTENSNGQTSDQSTTPPEMPSGENGGNGSDSTTPPEMPSGESGGNSGDSTTPPEMPSGESGGNGSDSTTPPEMPSGNGQGGNGQMGQGGPGNGGNFDPNSNTTGSTTTSDNESSTEITMPVMTNTVDLDQEISVPYIVLFAVEGALIGLLVAYLILSKMNLLTFGEVMGNGKNIMIVLLTAAMLALCTGLASYEGSNYFIEKKTDEFTESMTESMSQNMMPGGSMTGGESQGSSSVALAGATTVEDVQELTGEYTSENEDENAILVNGGTLTLSDATITKTGDTSDTESSEFYGLNAGILVEDGSADISDTTITTDAKGANAVFSTNENSTINISNTVINTSGDSSRGLDATYGGTITGDQLTITTQGQSCATLATDRGEGTVTVSNSQLETNGLGSPVIYSTGNISLDSSTGTATQSQMVVVEGKNSATVTNSSLTGQGNGNRGDVDECGIMIYQSMSGDADEGVGSFSATDSTLTLLNEEAPMFFVTNTSASISLENTKLAFTSGKLLTIQGTSEWGNEGSNGGNVTFTATNEELEGEITVDELSALALTLTKSTYQGMINTANTASSITLTLDSDSTFTLTGDTYITELSDADTTYSNIDLNGYTLYVNGTALSK